MNGADEVRSGCAGEFEAEFPVAVGFCVGGDFHAGGEVDEDDFIARGGFVGGAVGYGAGESLGGAAVLWDSASGLTFPLAKVQKFLDNGREDSVQFFAKVMMEKLE